MVFELALTDFPRGKIPRTTAQQKRYNSKTGCFFDSDSMTAAKFYYNSRFCRKRVEMHLSEPLADPVRLTVVFNFKAPRKKDIGKPKPTRPDCDNAVKMIQDCLMSAGILKDDSLIYDLRVAKFWAVSESVFVRVEAFEE